jgi:hypothetical protein
MKKAIVFLVVALAIPTSVAFAKAPTTHTNQSKAAPKVMYVLKGTFSSYSAATSTADGSISITVNHSNYHGRALKGQTLTFAVSMSTRITNQNGKALSTVADGAKGMVKFRAPKKVSGDLATTLPTMAKAFHIIVRKAAS